MSESSLKEQLSARNLAKLFYQSDLSQVSPSTTETTLTGSARFILHRTRQKIGQTDIGSRTPSEKELFQFVKSVEEEQRESLSEEERTVVVQALARSYEDFDVLTLLIDDISINDIIVRSFDDISFQRGRANYQTGLAFPDSETYKAFVEQLLKRAGKSCTVATPVIDAAIGSNIRLCVTHESLTPEGVSPLLTIRLARHSKVSLDALAQSGLAPKLILDYLAALVRSGECTLLISGEVGTGKTTLVKALASSIPEEEAILIIEDTQEVRLERKFVRTILTREANTEGVGRVSPAQAIRTGMRMAMNRIILGEMRDGEAAESFIDASASGHPGMSTIHSKSARNAISRLELFLSRAQGSVGIETIRRQISGAVSVVVYLGVDPVERQRRILEVVEVDTSSEGIIQLSPIFEYRPNSEIPLWVRTSGVTKYHGVLRENAIALPPSGKQLGFDLTHSYLTYNSSSSRICKRANA